jgi:retinol dehydrogenase 12
MNPTINSSANPSANQPLAGRVVLITGANTGIGRVTACTLARQGAHVFIATRSLQRTQAVLDEIHQFNGKAEWLALDLGDLKSVRSCAQAFLARKLPLHILINNAGLANVGGLTASGFDMAFGTNHIGHFLLTKLLLDCLKASSPARVVTVASEMHYKAKVFDWSTLQQPKKSLTGMPEYSLSKLANVLFSAELARRLKGTGVTTYAVHPGVVATDIWRSLPGLLQPVVKLFMLSEEKGAATTLYCATDASLAQQSGWYYDACKLKRASTLGQDDALAAQLWQRSEAWVG